MRKVKYLLCIFAVAIILIFAGTTGVEASLYLNNLDFDVQINDDGSMNVVETWNIDVSDTNTLYKTFEIDKDKYSALTNISVKDITNGTDKTFKKSNIWKYHLDKNYYFGGINNDNEYEIAWGVDINSSDTRKYQISYTVIDAIKKYGDCSELCWQFVGERFEIDARKINGVIKLPNPVENKSDIKVWGHTEYLNGEVKINSLKEVSFSLNKYRAGKFVEIRLLMPNYIMNNLQTTSSENKIQEIVSQEEVWAEEANAKRQKRDNNIKIIVACGVTVIGLAGVFFLTRISKYRRILKENPKIVPDMKLEYYRELPDETATPIEANFMISKTGIISQNISAIILNLTLKGYLKAEAIDKKIEFEIVEKDKSSLEKEEKEVLELLEKAYNNKTKKQVSELKKVTMKDLEKYIQKRPTAFEKLQTDFEKIAKSKAEQKGKFDRKLEKKSENYVAALIGYIMAIIIIIISIIGLSISAFRNYK